MFLKPPPTSWCGWFSPWGVQFLIEPYLWVWKVYSLFGTLTLRHTYVTTKNVINVKINCWNNILQETHWFFTNTLKYIIRRRYCVIIYVGHFFLTHVFRFLSDPWFIRRNPFFLRQSSCSLRKNPLFLRQHLSFSFPLCW